jgi:Flp pilus assembly protein TadG
MKTKCNKGQALIELTLLVPFFIVLTLLVADLARIFYFSMGMTHAVRAGAQYGFRRSTDSDGIIAAAVAAGADVGLTTSEVTPAPYRYWRCPNDPTTLENSTFPIPPNSCGAEQPLTYIKVEATKDFSTIYGGYAWIPETVTITRVAQMRVP